MRITSIQTTPIEVPLRPELAIRSGRGGAHLRSPFLLVKILTGGDLYGLGEVSCTPRWSGEDHRTAAHLIDRYFALALVGHDPEQIEPLTVALDRAVAGNYFTKAALEMALWDLRGKILGQPLWQMLGPACRQSIPLKWSISAQPPEKAAVIAQWAIDRGFRAMKVKVGTQPEDDLARVRAVREAVGPEIKLGVDANGGWTKETAIQTIPRLLDLGIAFIEQPLPPDDIFATVELAGHFDVPIVADESIWSLRDAQTLAHLRAAHAFSIYTGKAGGIGPARAIASFAGSANIPCTLGSNLELGVGSAAMIHLALATPNIQAELWPCDIIGPFYYQDDILRSPLRLENGLAFPPAGPGLGVELDEEKVKRFSV